MQITVFSIKRQDQAGSHLTLASSLASIDQVAALNANVLVDLVSAMRHGPSFNGDRPFYRDRRGTINYLDSNFFRCIAAIGTDSSHWRTVVKSASHPLVRASLAQNTRVLAIDRKLIVWQSRHDESPIVREAAKSNLSGRPMSARNIKGISPAVAELSVAYLTLLRQLHHLACARLAIISQIQELSAVLRAVPKEIVDTVNNQLTQMHDYDNRVVNTINALLPKLQSVIFIMRQVDNAIAIQEHLVDLNNSAAGLAIADLPNIMIDAVQEINRLHQDANIRMDSVSAYSYMNITTGA
jgi:hypothetical protein